jgi:GxxExxY protein
LAFRRQVPLPVVYKGIRLDCGYRMDVLVENRVILELKAVERLLPVHDAQVLTYMKLSGTRTGLLLNFNTAVLKDGIRRLML